MSRPNRSLIFPLDNVEELAQIMAVPGGDLFHVGLNRWNGNVVLTYQDHPEARFFIRLIVAQLSNVVDIFDADSYREPNSGLIDIEDAGLRESVYGFDPLPSSPRAVRSAKEVVSCG